MNEYITSVAEVARFLAGLGLVTIGLAGLKRLVERRRWRHFRSLAQGFASEAFQRGVSEQRALRQVSDEEWKGIAEELLTDVGMTAAEATQLLPTAVVVLKSRYQELDHVRRKPR